VKVQLNNRQETYAIATQNTCATCVRVCNVCVCVCEERGELSAWEGLQQQPQTRASCT
jgi:hypothetical protein